MKLKELKQIELILKKGSEEALEKYRIYKNELVEKYGTNWLTDKCTEEERNKLNQLHRDFLEVNDAYVSFTDMEWR